MIFDWVVLKFFFCQVGQIWKSPTALWYTITLPDCMLQDSSQKGGKNLPLIVKRMPHASSFFGVFSLARTLVLSFVFFMVVIIFRGPGMPWWWLWGTLGQNILWKLFFRPREILTKLSRWLKNFKNKQNPREISYVVLKMIRIFFFKDSATMYIWWGRHAPDFGVTSVKWPLFYLKSKFCKVSYYITQETC